MARVVCGRAIASLCLGEGAKLGRMYVNRAKNILKAAVVGSEGRARHIAEEDGEAIGVCTTVLEKTGLTCVLKESKGVRSTAVGG